MQNFLMYFKVFFVILGVTLSNLIGGWDTAIKILMFFVVVDFITGIMAGSCENKLSSAVSYKGILKKIFIFIIVAVAFQVDVLTQMNIFRAAAIFFYIANEGISILENAGRMGVEYPEALQKILIQLKETNDDNLQGNTLVEDEAKKSE